MPLPPFFDKPPQITGAKGNYTYQSRQPGLLSRIGAVGESAIAPWVQLYGGNMDYQIAQQKLQMQQDQMDMEFQRYLAQTGVGKPIFTIDPVTNQIISLGNVPKGSQVMYPSSMQSPQEKTEQKLKQEAQSDLQKQIPEVNDLFTAFDAVEKYAKELGDFKPGVFNQTVARVKTGVGEYAQDPKVANYIGAVNQQLAKIARKQNDEKGALSDFDVERVLKGLGQTTTPLDVKINLLNEMRSAAKQKITGRFDSAGMDKESLNKKYPDFYKRLFGGEGQDSTLIDQYMKKYPNRSREEIIRAIERKSGGRK